MVLGAGRQVTGPCPVPPPGQRVRRAAPPDVRESHRTSRARAELLTHPKLGSSWEGFVIEQVLAAEQHDDAFFWATYQGAEIDLVLRRGERLLGVECKRADAPRMTPSIRIALDDLGLRRVAVVYPGEQRYAIADRVEAVPVRELLTPGQLFRE
jgi:uncharacterized protein